MRGKTEPKVIIAGAGPAGLATALTLNKRGIPVSLVERDDRAGTHSYALALHPSTYRKLQEWEVAPGLDKNALHLDKLVFCDHKEARHTLDLTSVEGMEEGLVVVGQDHLETALIAPLEAAHVPVQWSHRLSAIEQDEAGVTADLEELVEGMSGYAMARLEWQVNRERSAQASYLVGADGHFSMVRRRLGIEFPKVAPTQSFAVFEFKSDYAHEREVRIVFGEEGTSVLWPLPGGYCRWSFEIGESAAEQYTRDKDRLFMQVGSQGYHVLEAGMLQEMIRQRAPWFDGSVKAFRWRMIVRFERRLAERFGRDRIWIAGDAGHLTGPVGMQSMNIGIHEGVGLGTRLADILEGKSEPEVLAEYGSERLAEWKQLLGQTVRLRARDSADAIIADHADRLLSCLPASAQTLPLLAKALDLEVETL